MKRVASLLLLVAAAVFSAWLLDRLDESAPPRHKAERHDPDYYMVDFVRTQMGLRGLPKNKLRADYMVHYPDDDTIELLRPNLEIYRDQQAPWHVLAERGWLSSDNEVVYLYGEVRIWRNSPDGERQLELITSDLKVLPKDEYAETAKAVTLLGPNTRYEAVGMRMQLGKGRLELLNEVKSRYEKTSTL